MKISELREGLNRVSLKAEVIEVSEPREILTRFGTSTTLTVATLKDESGEIKVALWGKQSEGIEVGKTVEIIGGFTKTFRDVLQLGIGRNGTIKVIE